MENGSTAAKKYFIGERLKCTLDHETAEGITAEHGVAAIKGFKIPGYFLTGEATTLKRYIDENPLKGIPYQILLRNTPEGGFVRREEFRHEGEDVTLLGIGPMVPTCCMDVGFALDAFPTVYDVAFECLNELSSRTSQECYFYAPIPDTVQPYSNDKGNISIVVGACAPGEVHISERDEIFNIRIADYGSKTLVCGPTYGRGNIISVTHDDKRTEIIGQIVDGTLYLFIPYKTASTSLVTNHNRIKQLFEKVLRAVWNAQFDAPHASKSVALKKLDMYNATVKLHEKNVSDAAFKSAVELDVELYQLEQRRHELMVQKRMLRMNVVGHLGREKSPEEIAKEWKELRKMKDLTSIYTEVLGIHADTVPIVIEHDGIKTDVGTFTIRISAEGKVSVWSRKSTHRDAIAHPHIGVSGNPCFGNMTLAITEAAFEQQIPKTFEYVLKWLKEGYDPELADHKIEEWNEGYGK